MVLIVKEFPSNQVMMLNFALEGLVIFTSSVAVKATQMIPLV